MAAPSEPVNLFSSAWEVFALFAIPIGGGIPAGVLLAKSRGIQWPLMTVLYLISDVALACVFEPTMLLLAWASKRSPFLARFRVAFKKSTDKTIARYGLHPSALSLVMVSFGVDPMTGRTAALTAGHGFVTGWMLAIAGDMLFFALLMVSTLCLNNLLGDGTWTAVIIMVGMTLVPVLVRRVRGREIVK
jgi:hypothetical protein